MKKCIICREQKEHFNDEHVIPEAIKGYYHIFSVCVDCNSKMGEKIDGALINHKFIEFSRSILGIKGKAKSVPNPFAGTHELKDDPNQKTLLKLNSEGQYQVHLIPNVPKFDELPSSFEIVLDKKDAHQIDIIVEKFLKRHGLDKSQVTTELTNHEVEHPFVKMQMKIDLHNFKLGLLKIAYEYSVDQIPKYFDDPQALLISKILLNADFENFYEKVVSYGSGFTKETMAGLEHLIDLHNNNHYLILQDTEQFGLLCFVNLFNQFHIAFKMTENFGFLDEGMLVGKNDIDAHTWQVLKTSELIDEIYTPEDWRYGYVFKDEAEQQMFLKDQDLPNFHCNENVYNKHGQLIFNGLEDLIKIPDLKMEKVGDTKNAMITILHFEDELFHHFKHVDKFYQFSSVKCSRIRHTKL